MYLNMCICLGGEKRVAGLDCFQRCLEALEHFKSKDIKCTQDLGMALEDKERQLRVR